MKKFELLGRFKDEDGTEKFVFEVSNGIIELTWIKNKNGIAVFCLPTHHYCNLGCKFCHLTEQGDRKKAMIPISAKDMVNTLNSVLKSHINANKLLLSFMGVGEPFLNLNLIFDTLDYFRKNTNKTVGLALASMMLTPEPFKHIIEKIKKDNLPLKIHFSLHSPKEKTRKDIIPSASTTIIECLEALINYQSIVSSNPDVIKNLSQFHKQPNPIEIHYTVINKVNDSDQDLAKVIEWGNKYRIPFKILKFNPTESLKRSPKTEFWFNELSKNYGAPVYFYAPPGPNIGSSCGQFTKHYYLGSDSPQELEEFKAWKKKYEIAK